MSTVVEGALVPLHQLRAGQRSDFFARLTEVSNGTTKTGQPFLRVKFGDRQRTAGCPVWSDSPHFKSFRDDWKVGQFFKLRAQYDEGRYGPELKLERLRPITDDEPGFDEKLLVKASRFDVDELFEELIEAADSIEEPALAELVRRILYDRRDEFVKHPAAVQFHHAFLGGLLEHTASVLRNGLFLVERYRGAYPELDPPLNRDL
ncbi:MAG: 3'-5' exoribonuclease YhaM family protein, partial [Planctomycetia bacterium]